MKIGVSSYSFSQLLKKGELSQLTAVKSAKELGFEAIEFTDLTPPESISQEDWAKQIRDEAQKCGIEISAYVIGANLAQKDATEEIDRIKKQIDIANILGAKFFRHDAMSDYKDFRSFDSALPYLAESIRKITSYAQTLGIKTMVENHGLICQDSDRVEKLVNAVNHPNFGLLVDMGNFMCADENPAISVSRVANLGFLIHAKDMVLEKFGTTENPQGYFQTRGCNYLKGVAVGKGDVPVKQCVAILKQAGYDGYIDIEFEGEENCIEELKFGLNYLKEII